MILDDVARCSGHAINENGDIEGCAIRHLCQRYTEPFRSGLGSIFAPSLPMVRGECESLIPENGHGSP